MARKSSGSHKEDCRCVVCTAARKKSRASASTSRRGAGTRGRSSTKSRSASTRRSSSAAASRTTRSRASSRTQARGSRTSSSRSAAAHALTDHDEIRRWAEERGAHPACVRRTGGKGDIGMIRLDFPGYSGADSLEEISWDQWFEKFDDNNLALLTQDTTARGQRSNFNKLIGRDTAQRRQRGERSASRHSGNSHGTHRRAA